SVPGSRGDRSSLAAGRGARPRSVVKHLALLCRREGRAIYIDRSKPGRLKAVVVRTNLIKIMDCATAHEKRSAREHKSEARSGTISLGYLTELIRVPFRHASIFRDRGAHSG